MKNRFKILFFSIFLPVFINGQNLEELVFVSKYGYEKNKYILFNYCNSVFQYNGILTNGKNGIVYKGKDYVITNVFKIENDVWFFKENNKWILFFDKNRISEYSEIIINNRKYILKWTKPSNDIYGLTDVFRLELIPIGFQQNHLNSYIFTPKQGFVIIEKYTGDLYREDIFP